MSAHPTITWRPSAPQYELHHQTHYKLRKKKKSYERWTENDKNDNLLPKKRGPTTLSVQIESHPNRTLTTNHVSYLKPRASGLPFAGHRTQIRTVGPLRNSDRKDGDVTTTGKFIRPVHPPTSGPKLTSFVPSLVESTRRVYTRGGPRGGYRGISQMQGGTRGAHVRTQVAFLVVAVRVDS